MKKLRRGFFSGWYLTIILILIEMAILIFFEFGGDSFIIWQLTSDNPTAINVFKILQQIFLGARLFFTFVAVILFFRITNKFQDPEFKIPWLIFIFVFPFVTVCFYLFLANHGLPLKDQKILKSVIKQSSPYFEISKREGNLFKKELGEAVGAFRYLNNTAKVGVHTNNRVTYFNDGDEFFPSLIEGLKQAKEFIFIETFIISDGQLWTQISDILKEKALNGVEVRIIYDDMGCSGTISARTPKRLRKFGIKCYKFHPLRPILSGVYNNRDHRKIFVIDHQMGFTGGCNIADEYANIVKRFGYWKDTMVKIEGSAINNLIMTFLENYDLSSRQISDYSHYLDYDYPKFKDDGFVMPFGDGPGDIDDELIGEQNFINLLSYAKKEIYISTPYLIPTYQLMDSLRNAALRGVDVHIFIPGKADKKLIYRITKSNFKPLLSVGVKIHIYTPGFNHMKTCLADGDLAFVGTINLDYRSLVHHFECGTLLYKTQCISSIKKDFNEMVAASQLVPSDYKMGLFSRSICGLLKIFTILF